MKKIFFVLLSVVTTFACFSCGSDDEVNPSSGSGDEVNPSSSVSGESEGHKYVELAGYKWATENVFGEVTEGMSTFNKKEHDDTYGDTYDFDNAIIACESWGVNWQLPTNKQWEALIDQCNWTWKTGYSFGGKTMNGYLVSDKNDSSKFIFLPATTYSSFLNSYRGYYWSSTPSDRYSGVYKLLFDSGNPYVEDLDLSSCSVRPVLAESEKPASTTTGKANATIWGRKVSVKWVQLWKNGPKFAEYNVGVGQNGKAESSGGHYCWGSSIDRDPKGNCASTSYPLYGSYDTAWNLWGRNWRIPTQTELLALRNNCDVVWTTVNGVNGRKFTGKGEYASNSVFLPAEGYDWRGELYNNGSAGYYLSSTPYVSKSDVYLLFFDSAYLDLDFNEPHRGYSVRAVLAETEPDKEPVEEPSEPDPTTIGTAKATIDGSKVDVKWVQLWKNGPKFAEYNVGVTDGKAESYGGYYAWGGSRDKVNDHNNGDSNLEGDTDTATKLWGEYWRMPTIAEIRALVVYCDEVWTTVNGVKGLKFTGKGDYASNSVFLPEAGYYHKGNFYDISCYYWSSTKRGSIDACAFSTTYSDRADMDRDFGFSVRAVLAE